MVIAEPEVDVDPLAVTSFFWFLPYSEVKDLGGQGERVFSFEQRFLPSDKWSAAEWYYTSEASGLRAQSDHMVMIQVVNKPFVPSERKPVRPDDWLDADIRHTGEETAIPGYIVEPFTAELKFYVVKYFSFFAKTHEWHSLSMGVLTPQEVLQMSVVKVTDPEVYNEDAERTPRRNGPEDIRMGTYEKDTYCGTCEKTWENNFERSCPGHFGHISLEVPIPNYLFLGGSKEPFKASPLMYAVNSTCKHCSRILLDETNTVVLEETAAAVRESNLMNTAGYDIIRKTFRSLLDKQFNLKGSVPKSLMCPHCSEVSPQVRFALAPVGSFRFVFFPKESIYDEERDEMLFFPYKEVHDWLADIPERDAAALGFSEGSRPEHMFFTELPVIPNTARPPAESPSGAMIPNDLTELYSNIVKVNNRIKRERGASTQVERLSRSLFQAVAQLQTGQKDSIGSGGMRLAMTRAGSTPRNMRGLLDNITGVGRQKNLIRRQHQAKVGEHVGYSVITPDPSLDIEEMGLPITACAELTLREEVTEDNIEFLRMCVGNGKQTPVHKGLKYKQYDSSRYPGAHGIIRKGGGRIDLEFKRVLPEFREEQRMLTVESLEVGDIVERNIIRGDIVLFTRAPALHRQSMIAFRVVPIKDRSFSFNPSVCIPFNADYDGDAMRVFVPQSKEAIEEAKGLMLTPQQMLHTRYGRTFITFDQDEISGSYLLTFKSKGSEGIHPNQRNGWGFDNDGHPILSKHRAMNLLSRAFIRESDGNISYPLSLPSPIASGEFKGCYRGRDIVSMFIPEGINARFKAKDKTTDVVIEDGKVIEGVLDDQFFGTKSGVLASAFIYRFGWDEGNEQLARMTNMLSRVVFAAHIEYGFSLGIADISFKDRPGFYEVLDEKFAETSAAIGEIERLFREKRISEIKGLDMKVALKDPMMAKEAVISKLVDEYESFCLSAVKSNQESTNAMNITLNSGGRGNPGQLQQMTGTFGQQRLNGPGRPKHGVNHDRTLPHFKRGEFSGESQGLIKTCYARGHSPEGFWFASTAGIRSTMESSQGGIQKSGYMEHRMKRAMENLMVDDRHRVMDIRSDTVVSYSVGADNLRPFHARGPDNADGVVFSLDPFLLDIECEHGVVLKDECSQCTGRGSTVSLDFLPFNIRSEVQKHITGRTLSRSENARAKSALQHYYTESMVEPGEMIGSTAAANLGEPATQAGLRAFHGGGKGSVPTVDRLVQYLDLKKKEQEQPSTTVFLKEEFSTEENAERLANFCTGLRMNEIVQRVDYIPEQYQIHVIFDPMYSTLFDVDMEWVRHTLTKSMGKMGRQVLSIDATSALIQCHAEHRDLLIAKEFLASIPVSGIRDAELALKIEPGANGRWGIEIKGPIKGSDSNQPNSFWKDIQTMLGEYVDFSLTKFTDTWMVYTIYGLEAALMHLTEMLWGQMNGTSGGKGLGDLDYRYIRMMADYLGMYGRPIGMSKAGHMVKYNKSTLAAMGGEDPWMSLVPGAAIGNVDMLRGPVEAITAGKFLTIGETYRRKRQGDNA